MPGNADQQNPDQQNSDQQNADQSNNQSGNYMGTQNQSPIGSLIPAAGGLSIQIVSYGLDSAGNVAFTRPGLLLCTLCLISDTSGNIYLAANPAP